MTNIETQLPQRGTMQEKLASKEATVIGMNMRIGDIHDKMEDYDRSIITIVTGIAERRDLARVNDNCEHIVNDFIRTKLHIDCEMSFDRVHRLGRYSPFQRFPRPTVVKFTFYKDEVFKAVARSDVSV